MFKKLKDSFIHLQLKVKKKNNKIKHQTHAEITTNKQFVSNDH